jgi:hypothetical protein
VKRPLAFFAVLALALTGCTKAVEITDPVLPIVAPLTTFKVQFVAQFDPGTFRAELDGQDVTPQFAPTAVAGGTATMRLPDTTQEGFTGGALIGTSPPPSRLPVSGLDPNIHFTPGVAPGGVPSGPSGGGTGKATPNISMHTHQLHVSGLCNGIICDTTDDLVFFPIHLVGVPTTLNVRVGSTAQVTVETFPAMSTPLKVRVRPSSISVRLNGLAPGVALDNVVIPANGSSGPISVTGMVSSNLILIIEARGTQMGSITGLVNP